MANSYTQLYIHIVFAVKGRHNLIQAAWSEELYKYIGGIINGQGQKCIIINGMPDHVHVFVGMQPILSVAELVRDIKANSSRFINEKHWVMGKFAWQEGYGAFSYGHSQVEQVYHYIARQQEHHSKHSFKEEYKALLAKFDITFEEKYLFDFETL